MSTLITLIALLFGTIGDDVTANDGDLVTSPLGG